MKSKENIINPVTIDISDAKNTVNIIRNNFLNVHDILRRFDLNEASKFLDKNTHFQNEHNKNHPHKHHDHKKHTGCSHAHTGNIWIPKEHRTQKEQCLFELTQFWKMQVDLPEILEYLSDRFNNIKKQGLKDWNSEAEAFVLQEVMKNGVNQYYHSRLIKELGVKTKNYSTDHMLVANPSQFEKLFPKFDLNSIPRTVISRMFDRKNVINWNGSNQNVNQNGDKFEGLFFNIENFVQNYNHFELLKKEMFYLETDGRFEKRIEQMVEKEEKHLWLSFGEIDKESFPGYFI